MLRIRQYGLGTFVGIGILFVMAISPVYADAEIPASIAVRCGNLLVRFDGAKFWTLNRIEYKGTLLGLDYPGSHYGSVVNFPGVGFIGSGHRENEDEKVIALRCFVDGRPAAPEAVPGNDPVKTFRMGRETAIRDLSFVNTVELRDDRIYETVELKSEKEQPVSFIYNFMHPWTLSATSFLAGTDEGKELKGAFTGSEKFVVEEPMDWIAVYDPSSGKGGVSRLLAKPQVGGAEMLLWDVGRLYRKFYLRSFSTEGQPIPAGFRGEYKLVTGFFEAGEEGWEQSARKLADDLREEKKAE